MLPGTCRYEGPRFQKFPSSARIFAQRNLEDVEELIAERKLCRYVLLADLRVQYAFARRQRYSTRLKVEGCFFTFFRARPRFQMDALHSFMGEDAGFDIEVQVRSCRIRHKNANKRTQDSTLGWQMRGCRIGHWNAISCSILKIFQKYLIKFCENLEKYFKKTFSEGFSVCNNGTKKF